MSCTLERQGEGNQSAMGSRMRDYLIEQARQAEELGHRMRVEHRPMREEWVSDSGRRDKYWAVCSCGYTSARRNTHGLALMALGIAFMTLMSGVILVLPAFFAGLFVDPATPAGARVVELAVALLVASLLIGFGTMLAIMWVTSRVYRVGMLMYGKRASIPEALRWARQA